ncbi:MAG TPA: SlyX family protein [Treponemataceae bacterium]|nr:SlyX family protein [Treponemataceae bacterium]
MSDQGEQRIIGLETKMAYLDDFMAKIQAITVEHTDAIERLKAENRALRAKLGEVEDQLQDLPNQRPPHY